METITVAAALRLALARAGLLKPAWTGIPARAAGRGRRAREAAHRVIRRFGYLQVDTVSVAGARSHAIVLMSRLDGFEPALAEELLLALDGHGWAAIGTFAQTWRLRNRPRDLDPALGRDADAFELSVGV